MQEKINKQSKIIIFMKKIIFEIFLYKKSLKIFLQKVQTIKIETNLSRKLGYPRVLLLHSGRVGFFKPTKIRVRVASGIRKLLSIGSGFRVFGYPTEPYCKFIIQALIICNVKPQYETFFYRIFVILCQSSISMMQVNKGANQYG